MIGQTEDKRETMRSTDDTPLPAASEVLSAVAAGVGAGASAQTGRRARGRAPAPPTAHRHPPPGPGPGARGARSTYSTRVAEIHCALRPEVVVRP